VSGKADSLTIEIILTLTVVLGVLLMLSVTSIATDVILLAAMIAVCVLGIVTPSQALQGFSNTGVMTVAALYIVVAGVRETGAMAWVSQRVFGHPRTLLAAQARLMTASAVLSSVINNTPVVAMFIPVAQDWATRLGMAVSKLLMPMNHIAILAGLCTLMGTSTNLVVNGLLTERFPESVMGIFDLIWVGVPLTIIGVVYTLLVGRWLLPDRRGAIEQLQNAREYSFEIQVVTGGPLVGRTVVEVGLRQMKRAYLLEIERGGRLITAVGPQETLHGGDVLTFVGVVDAIRDLRRIPGLNVVEGQDYKLDLRHSKRRLVELVLSGSSPLIGRSVREGGFRSLYRAAIISISRDGSRLEGKIGDVILRPGDTLLAETDDGFARRQRYNRDFLLVSALQDSTPPDFRRAPLALAILVSMIVAASLEWVDLFVASFIAAGLMVGTRCVALGVARRSVEYPIVVSIAASFALGQALTESGAAQLISEQITIFGGGNPLWVLCGIYLLTMVATEMITNNAAGVLMFPIAVATAEQAGVSFMPFVVVVMVAASAGFITPIGYQTNLMIYGPGGYRFGDYVRFGLPLSILVAIATLLIVPRIWPL
jgi:di/tricarboxylate transporter